MNWCDSCVVRRLWPGLPSTVYMTGCRRTACVWKMVGSSAGCRRRLVSACIVECDVSSRQKMRDACTCTEGNHAAGMVARRCHGHHEFHPNGSRVESVGVCQAVYANCIMHELISVFTLAGQNFVRRKYVKVSHSRCEDESQVQKANEYLCRSLCITPLANYSLNLNRFISLTPSCSFAALYGFAKRKVDALCTTLPLWLLPVPP